MKYLPFILVLFLSACQSTPAQQTSSETEPTSQTFAEYIRDSKPPAGPRHIVNEGVIDPIEAVVTAAQSAPNSFVGTFGMEVRNTGQLPGILFLNSELNYREQFNLTVAMDESVARYLTRTYGRNWFNDVIGKQIEVRGEAERVVIWFNCDGQRTSSYYYQTQIRVTHPEQFKIVP